MFTFQTFAATIPLNLVSGSGFCGDHTGEGRGHVTASYAAMLPREAVCGLVLGVNKEVTPEIDLTGPPTDPGISRLHAILVLQPDGSWAVVDPGSENGTAVNRAEIGFGRQTVLRNGDSIRIGVWTEITIVAPPTA